MAEDQKKHGETADDLGFVPPASIITKAHERVMARLKGMTPAEVLQLAIRAGIYTTDGKLTKHYQPT